MKSCATAFLALAMLAGCQRAPETRQYELSGQILVVRPETSEVLIRHGDIKGFMPGMTMPFKVKDPALLAGRSAGDLVTATLVVADESAWLETLTATGQAPLPDDAPATLPAAAGVHVLEPGDVVPDTPLASPEGAVSLRAARGMATAMTFVYTRCPLPDYCPLMDRRFAEVQRTVTGDAVLDRRVRLVSVSFDPEHDTPARLREHASALGANPAVWRFATIADPAAIDTFAATFGVNVIREKDGTITHNLRTVVIDPDGRVVSVRDGNTWAAEEIVSDLRKALGR
jgi:protein SCO1/2